VTRFSFFALAASLGLAGCTERLTTPGECPALCPGDPLIVRDTTLLAAAAGDSTFFGYVPRVGRTTLLVSDGLDAGEARSFVIFPTVRTDSVSLDAVFYEFLPDTVRFAFTLLSRDSTATGLTLYLHRIPLATDTTTTFADLEPLLGPTSIFDSIVVPDTLRAGVVSSSITDERIAELMMPAEDSGRVGVGLTVRASKATGVRLSVDASGGVAAPLYEIRGHAGIADTARQRQTLQVRPLDIGKVGYVFDRDFEAGADPDLLYVGGPSGARSLVRFVLPPDIDSAQVLRATLELTPAAPAVGLPNNPNGDSLAVRGVLADLGAKSPVLQSVGVQLSGRIVEGTTQPVLVDLRALVAQWQLENGPPSTVLLAHFQEGGTFMQPAFFSTRSATGQPRLRITYALPTRPGHP